MRKEKTENRLRDRILDLEFRLKLEKRIARKTLKDTIAKTRLDWFIIGFVSCILVQVIKIAIEGVF